MPLYINGATVKQDLFMKGKFRDFKVKTDSRIYVKDVLYSMLGPDVVGLTVAL